MFLSILLLSLLEASSASKYAFTTPPPVGVYDDPSDLRRAQSFLDTINRSVASQDKTVIRELFKSNFEYEGCGRKKYNKEQTVKLLTSYYRQDIAADYKVDYVQRIAKNKIEFLASSKVTYDSYIMSKFILNIHDDQLESGRRANCPVHLRGFSAPKNAETLSDDQIAQNFMNRVQRSVETRDEAVIRGLFNPNFVFEGCKGKKYNKAQFVKLLTGRFYEEIPIDYTIVFAQRAEDNPDQIDFLAHSNRSMPDSVTSRFRLNLHDQQLQSVRRAGCRRSRGFTAYKNAGTSVQKVKAAANVDPTSPPSEEVTETEKISETEEEAEEVYLDDEIAQNFMDRFKLSVKSRDEVLIRGLFMPNFVYEGCDRKVYNRDQFVEFLTDPVELFAGIPTNFTIFFSHRVEGNQYQMEFWAHSNDVMWIMIHLNLHEQQLLHAARMDCENEDSSDSKNRRNFADVSSTRKFIDFY